jgi:hypothetical protein
MSLVAESATEAPEALDRARMTEGYARKKLNDVERNNLTIRTL